MILRIPWLSQFDAKHVERAGPTACYRACRAMAAAVGVDFPESTESRLQVATEEDANGRAVAPSENTRGAVMAIRDALKRGVPVVVGVNYKRGSLNRDGITDHFLLVVGWSSTAEFPEVFLALDPGRQMDAGTTHNAELAVDDGQLVRTWPRRGGWLEMQVSMVVCACAWKR